MKDETALPQDHAKFRKEKSRWAKAAPRRGGVLGNGDALKSLSEFSLDILSGRSGERRRHTTTPARRGRGADGPGHGAKGGPRKAFQTIRGEHWNHPAGVGGLGAPHKDDASSAPSRRRLRNLRRRAERVEPRRSGALSGRL